MVYCYHGFKISYNFVVIWLIFVLGYEGVKQLLLMVSQKTSNSITRPYVSSNERQATTNQTGEVIVPNVLANLVRLWTDETSWESYSSSFKQGKPSKMASSIFY